MTYAKLITPHPLIIPPSIRIMNYDPNLLYQNKVTRMETTSLISSPLNKRIGVFGKSNIAPRYTHIQAHKPTQIPPDPSKSYTISLRLSQAAGEKRIAVMLESGLPSPICGPHPSTPILYYNPLSLICCPHVIQPYDTKHSSIHPHDVQAGESIVSDHALPSPHALIITY